MIGYSFWLYLVFLILSSWAVVFAITYKVCEPDVSNAWWILLVAGGVIWVLCLIGLYFKIRQNNMEIMVLRDMTYVPPDFDIPLYEPQQKNNFLKSGITPATLRKPIVNAQLPSRAYVPDYEQDYTM